MSQEQDQLLSGLREAILNYEEERAERLCFNITDCYRYLVQRYLKDLYKDSFPHSVYVQIPPFRDFLHYVYMAVACQTEVMNAQYFRLWGNHKKVLIADCLRAALRQVIQIGCSDSQYPGANNGITSPSFTPGASASQVPTPAIPTPMAPRSSSGLTFAALTKHNNAAAAKSQPPSSAPSELKKAFEDAVSARSRSSKAASQQSQSQKSARTPAGVPSSQAGAIVVDIPSGADKTSSDKTSSDKPASHKTAPDKTFSHKTAKTPSTRRSVRSKRSAATARSMKTPSLHE